MEKEISEKRKDFEKNNDKIKNNDRIKKDKKPKKEISSKHQSIKMIAYIILFLAITVAEFIIIELFFQKSITDFELCIIIKNITLIGVANLTLTALFHRMRPAMLVSTALMLLIGIANYFVIKFRGYGIVFLDFYAVKTAATVAGGYTYRLEREFWLGITGGVLCIAACFLFPKKIHKYFEKKRMIGSGICLAGVTILILWMNFGGVFFKNVTSLAWDHNIGINENGYILYFVTNAGMASIEEPVGYSAQKADEILSHYEERNTTESDEGRKTPNIIMIMNEAFSDLRVLGDFRTSENVWKFYDSLEENTIKGYALASVYGGYTANSEFEFLTGTSKAFLPGNPYLQYMEDYLPNLISNIKKEERVKTATAVHPYNPTGYNRNRVYPLLDFDEFFSIEDFENPALVREFVSDDADYQKIIELYEEKEEESSLCVFNVTMQNHNPYDDADYQFENPVTVTSFPVSSLVNQYLTLVKMSDQAIEKLVGYFEKQEEPTIIVFFGDHQPHLPDSFYQRVFEKEPMEFTQEDTVKKHMIPFFIWANYDIPEQYIEKTSLNYLRSIFLQAAGLSLTDYDRYLLDLSKDFPAISAVGCYDKEGNLYEISETGKCEGMEEELQKKLREYQIIQYNYLFDKENRVAEHFE